MAKTDLYTTIQVLDFVRPFYVFSLLITIIGIALFATLCIATLYSGGEQFQHGAQQMHAAQLASQAQQFDLSAATSALLDQAQILLGASGIYASEHGGSYPTDVKQLQDGRYLDAAVIPDTRVSTDTYHLVRDEQGFHVQLNLTNGEVCQDVAASSVREGPDNRPSDSDIPEKHAPYNCVTQGNSMTFTFQG